ncbi:MAG: envelope stress response membrane protein PspB [Bacteriovoracaceae bacterium]|nr:envelope stress response membrane protein PspB [Bacteriovoracaceae bacterium]
MGMFTFVIVLVFMIFVAPVWIFFSYLGKTRSGKMLSNEDEKMLEELWKMAQKMEDRVNTLETIFDSERKE